MKLTSEQRERVRFVLENEPMDALHMDVLQSPLELHQFAINYNCNAGFRPLRWLIRSPLCDKGTALYVYWQLGDVVWTAPEDRDVGREEDWDAAGLIAELETRFAAGFYQHQEIAFDPRGWLEWNRIDEYRWQKARQAGTLTFPEEMLQATPGEEVDPEWL